MKKFLPILFLLLMTFPGSVKAASPTFSLSPASSSVAVGESFTISVVLDTATQAITRAVAVISFDTTKLQVIDGNSSIVGTQIRQGTAISAVPSVNKVDVVTGKITYDTGVLTTAYKGSGTLATITFKTISAGSVIPTISLVDSQILSSTGTNLLSSVTNGTYTILEAEEEIGGVTTTSSTTPTTLPQTGALENTLIMLLLGGVLFGGSWFLRKKSLGV